MPKAATAPAPRIDPDAEVEVDSKTKPTVKPDQGLLKLYADLEKSKIVTGQKFAQIVDYIENHELESAQIKATLMARGLSKGSADMECSRILALLKPENAETREKWRNGEISLRTVRDAIKGKSRKEPQTPKQQIAALLAKAAAVAYPELEGIREFLELAKAAWNNEVATQQTEEIDEIEAVEGEEEEEEEISEEEETE